MPNFTYRANTSSPEFPLVSIQHGRTVIVGQIDNAQNQYRFSGANEKELGLPQAYYMHNVLPVHNGFQSCDFVQKASNYVPFFIAAANGTNPIPSVISWNDFGNVFDVVVSGGNMIARIRGDFLWTTISSLDGTGAWPDLNRPFFTKATINGVTYGLESQPGINSFRYKYTYSGGIFFVGTYAFIGAPAAALLRGIASVRGFGILWTELGLFWSSSINPLDFTPSLVTGAGGGSLQEAKGTICFVAPASFGAIIYCVGNCVAMIYTGNTSFPFTFAEIKGAGGYVSDQVIASDANSVAQFSYTTFGLQALTSTTASAALPEIVEFLSARIFEDYDEVGFAFSTTTLTAPLNKRLTLISNRFLVVSYGIAGATLGTNQFSHALIYDVELKRFGKFKIGHCDVYQWASVLDPTAEQLIGSIAFLDASAKVYVPRMYHAASATGGVILFGKYQYVRVRKIGLDKVTLENVEAAQVLRVSTLAAQDGKTTTEQIGYLNSANGLQREYLFDSVAENHSVLIQGAFDINSLILEFHTHGQT